MKQSQCNLQSDNLRFTIELLPALYNLTIYDLQEKTTIDGNKIFQVISRMNFYI